MVTVHHICTHYFSQRLLFSLRIFQSCIPLSNSQHVDFYSSKSLVTATSQRKSLCYSHFGRRGKLNTQQESKVPMIKSLSFRHIFFPSSSSILWGEGWWWCIWDNSRYISLTHQGQNNHAILVFLPLRFWSNTAAFLCH